VLVTHELEVETGAVNLSLRGLHVAAPDGRSLIRASHVKFGPGVTALVGPNGAGKSTLLRALATLHPAGGSILLNGIDSAREPRKFLEQLVYLPQNFATYPELTGQEFLEYALQLRGAARREARSVATAWLEAVGLRQAAKTKTGAYSQGMRQRLGFAYAMQLDVTLYLMDEPFAGVDPESRNTMTDLLFRLGGDRIAIVSTHHVDEMFARGAGFAKIAEGELVR
jgi:ABC-2 type transport system ATP-binding protein